MRECVGPNQLPAAASYECPEIWMVFELAAGSRYVFQASSAILAPTKLGEKWKDGGLPKATSPKSVMYGTWMALNRHAVRYNEDRHEQNLTPVHDRIDSPL